MEYVREPFLETYSCGCSRLQRNLEMQAIVILDNIEKWQMIGKPTWEYMDENCLEKLNRMHIFWEIWGQSFPLYGYGISGAFLFRWIL